MSGCHIRQADEAIIVVPDSETHECGCERAWFVEASEDDVLFVVRVTTARCLKPAAAAMIRSYSARQH
jgi:hypothetical protein